MSARTDEEATQNQANSGVTPQKIQSMLASQLAATHVDVEDMSGESEFLRGYRPSISHYV